MNTTDSSTNGSSVNATESADNEFDYGFTQTECDWCEEIKDCRGMEDFPGNVVLVVCEDCDKKNTNNKENIMDNSTFPTIQHEGETMFLHVEGNCGLCDGLIQHPCYNPTEVDVPTLDDLFLTSVGVDPAITITNNKENITMDTNITLPICDALTTKGCTNKGRFDLEAYVSGDVARKSLTADLIGGNWTIMDLHVCKTHLATLNQGKAINLKPGVNTLERFNLLVDFERNLFSIEVLGQDPIHMEDHYNGDTAKEEEMDNEYDTELAYEAALAKMGDVKFYVDSFPLGGHVLIELCGHEDCAMALHEWGAEASHEVCCGATGDDCPHYMVWTCLERDNDAPVATESPLEATEGISCGHCKGKHPTVAEVRACYGAPEKAATTPLSEKVMVSDNGYSRQWFKTNAEAVKHVKTMDATKKGMNPAKNGNGFWAWWKS